jgi:antitoxin component YwqK of YwqJK toxin-antitoxin module
MACGSGTTSEKPAPVQPPATHTAQAIDAGVPDAPPPPKLSCDPGTQPTPAPAPEPTWYCTRTDGVRHGPFIRMFPDGSIEIIGMYKEGRLDGAWERHYPSGAKAEEGSYTAGMKHGKWRQLGPGGNVVGEYEMKAGTGVEVRWYDDGVKYSEVTRKAGVLDGPATTYAPDGSAVITEKFVSGKLDGHHEVGTRQTMRVDETFANGVRRGQRQIWRFGLLAVDETYDRYGRLDGPYVQWRERKVIRVKGNYSAGKRDGAWVWFDRDNNKEREGTYVAGRKDGAWTEWYENKVAYTGQFSNGKHDGTFTYFNRDGSELGHFEIKDGTGVVQTFWPNRRVSSKQRVYNGYADGAYLEYTLRGKLVIDGHMAGEYRHGAWKEFTESGVPLVEATYKHGRPDGVVKKFADG